MKGSILVAEDDEVIRREFKEYFERRNYEVTLACDGQEALAALDRSQEPFGAMVLDLRMPSMSGEELLCRLRPRRFGNPPVIVLSAHFDRNAVRLCLDTEIVKCMFCKPCEVSDIERAVDAVVRGDDLALWSLAGDTASGIRVLYCPHMVVYRLTPDLQELVEAEYPIGSLVGRREVALRSFFLDRTDHPASERTDADETLFVVARRWDSWYPSFFAVPGGCYAVIGPRQADGHSACAIIDPGSRCLEVLSDLGIPVHDIASCVISHNHPDHVAGIFELLASRYALGLSTRGWCNRATVGMLGDCSGFSLEMNELSTSVNSLLFSYAGTYGETRKVEIIGFPTAHRESGRSSASLGLAISCSLDDPQGNRSIGKAAILGDTEYDPAQHLSFLDLLTSEGMRFVVLHVGSAQVKQREGGHLYYPGLKILLADMDRQLKQKGRTGPRLPVLLSQWGLEHATKTQISAICGRDLGEFDDRSLMLEIAKQLNQDLHMICVLPADIGLTIGLETGLVHLPDGSAKGADEVRAIVTPEGIEYR